MAKLIIVNREKLKASLKKMEELRANNEQWQAEKQKIEKDNAKEKARRDAEFAAKKTEEKERE